jgi:biopolymer transport protein ExbD
MNDSIFSSGRSIFGSDDSEDTEINMIALLSILSNMLFFLLASFGIAVISLVAANVPTIAEADEVFMVDKEKVTVTLTITKKGFSITAVNEMMTPKEAKMLEEKIPRTKKSFNYDALNKYLYRIKRRYKKSDTIVITPEPYISYNTIIQAMDASRQIEVEVEGRKLQYPLFPSAVISTLAK